MFKLLLKAETVHSVQNIYDSSTGSAAYIFVHTDLCECVAYMR